MILLIIVSACLANLPCKYNGGYNTNPLITRWVEEGKAIPVCPEVLGGLPTPREPNEIAGGDGFDVVDGRARVMTKSGRDCTKEFLEGAQKVLEIARTNEVTSAVLKQRSPSCGSSAIYNGGFCGKTIAGMGVLAALLTRAGLKVYSEENFTEFVSL